MPHVHQPVGRLGGHRRRYRSAHLARRGRSLPHRALAPWKRERGWKNLRLYSDLHDTYSRDYFGILPDGSQIPAFNVFTRRDGTIRHFWSGEMTGPTADPGQDPRGAPDPAPLWLVLDATPGGRGRDWYRKLDYNG
jgi:predicted dithiol-disulfide oxidoreductase (DUF899 family)